MRGAGWSRVTHPFATLCAPEGALTVRLACVRHAASVHPEPGSNSPLKLSRGGIPRAGSLGSVSWSLSRKSLALASDPSCLCPQRTASPPSGGSARGSKNLTCAPAGLPPGRLDLCCTRYPVLKVPSLGEVVSLAKQRADIVSNPGHFVKKEFSEIRNSFLTCVRICRSQAASG